MKRIALLLGSFLTAMVLAAPTPAPAPPKLLSTSPALWAVRVDPTLKTVSLTFDQHMIAAFTDWIGPSSVAPETNMESSLSPDGSTFGLHVKLQAGKTYVFALNEKGLSGVGFQNDKGVSAAPTYLVFQTLGNPTPEDAPPALLRASPPNGAQQVDPVRTNSIQLVFDKAMKATKHGLHLFEGSTEIDVRKARFQYAPDGKSFTLFYSFKPVTAYRIELNSVRDIGFASKTRIPLWPVQFAFTTGQAR